MACYRQYVQSISCYTFNNNFAVYISHLVKIFPDPKILLGEELVLFSPFCYMINLFSCIYAKIIENTLS